MRKNDATIMVRARAIISQTPSKSDDSVRGLFQQLQTLFTEGGITTKTVNYRWKTLLSKHCLPQSTLKKNLTAIRNQQAQNSGNRTLGREVVRPDGLHANNDEMAEIMYEHAPDRAGTAGSRFWIWSGKHNDTDKPPAGSWSKCKKFQFPGEYDCYQEMTEVSIKERFKPCRITKGQTNQVKATRFPQFQLLRYPSKGSNGSVVVPAERPGVGWYLVYIDQPVGKKKGKRKLSDYPIPRAAKRSKMENNVK